MTYTVSTTGTLTGLTCWVCGVDFALPEILHRKRTEDGKDFWCPNGHAIAYGPSLLDQEKKRRAAAEARATHADDQRRAAERQLSAARGQMTKLRKRVGNGVCPCCKRTFQQLGRHMKAKHPDYADSQ